ncbi:nuclear transport factor 2 family protein [Streptomyces mirabilis]
MSDSPNIALARRLYDSKGDPAVSQEVMAPDIIWDVTPGFPNGGVYNGLDSVGGDFFRRVFEVFESFYAEGEQFFEDADNHVFVLGHYRGVSKKGKTAKVRFIHLWTVRDGKLAHMQQAADSQIAQLALED